MSKIKSISFTSEYLAEYEHFMSVPNRSKYVCELIRKDLNGGGSYITMQDIEKLIDTRLKNIPTTTTVVETEDFTDEIRDTLQGLFGTSI